MSDILQKQVLVLNNDGTPLSLWPLSVNSVRRVLKALLKNKLNVLEEYSDSIMVSGIELKIPKVVLLKRYVKPIYKPVFSRDTVYIRDKYTCQYCHKQFKYSDLTFDHVIPISRFKDKHQATTWTNIVTACKKCNNEKDNKLLSETKFKLDKMPIMPSNKMLLKNVVELKRQGFSLPGVEKIIDWDNWLGI